MSTDMLGRCLTCGMHIDSTSALCLNCHTYAPNPMVSTVIVGGPMPSGVTITQQPAPVSATEPDAVRMLREGMRGQHALFNVNQEYVCAVAPLLEYIDALTARLAATERERDDVIACARGTSMDDAAIHSMRKYIAEKINIEDERNDLAVRLAEAEA